MIELEFCSATDPGLARENNEDSVTFDVDTRLAVLADGMGGYNAGEVASAMATTYIRSELSRWLAQVSARATGREIARAMEICVANANTSIFNAANSNPQYMGMGTTLVVGVFFKDALVLGHIGDSRCYLLRSNELSQITKDHSLLQEQLDAGLLTPEEASSSTQKNLVTRALGVDPAVLLETKQFDVKDGDIFLFCSDGLSDMVDNESIAEALRAEQTLSNKASQLVNLANANGGVDNISVFLAQAKVRQRRSGFFARWFA